MTKPLSTVRDWELFALVAKMLSVRQAAQSADLSPSVVSRRIAALEKRIGETLLVRTARGCALTAKGAEYARRLAYLGDGQRAVDAVVVDGGNGVAFKRIPVADDALHNVVSAILGYGDDHLRAAAGERKGHSGRERGRKGKGKKLFHNAFILPQIAPLCNTPFKKV